MSGPTGQTTAAVEAKGFKEGTGVQKKVLYGLLLLGLIAAPLAGAYPVFVLKVLCFALFACAFNLLIGFTGLLSFGHAAFFGGAGYAGTLPKSGTNGSRPGVRSARASRA